MAQVPAAVVPQLAMSLFCLAEGVESCCVCYKEGLSPAYQGLHPMILLLE